MKYSAERILTTHSGSLPRPDDLVTILVAQERSELHAQAVFEGYVTAALSVVVRKQAMSWLVLILAITAAFASPVVAEVKPQPADLMREGIGEWCYNPVSHPTETQKRDYVDFAVVQAKRAQEVYGVPGALLAAMSIRESGYGLTRLAILSNNVLSFKKPKNVQWQFGRPTFVLWCQPLTDEGNEYLLFGSKDAAFDYVAKVLAQRADLPYAKITQDYRDAIAGGADRKLAATNWLKAIAPIYAKDSEYVPAVLDYADNPMAPRSTPPKGQSLWELAP